jgi:hypothetical protein
MKLLKNTNDMFASFLQLGENFEELFLSNHRRQHYGSV